jgi:hypothetical protein
VLPLTKKPGPARHKSFSLFVAYLREYRAKILESAGWSQCPPERGNFARGTSMRLARSAYEKQEKLNPAELVARGLKSCRGQSRSVEVTEERIVEPRGDKRVAVCKLGVLPSQSQHP